MLDPYGCPFALDLDLRYINSRPSRLGFSRATRLSILARATPHAMQQYKAFIVVPYLLCHSRQLAMGAPAPRQCIKPDALVKYQFGSQRTDLDRQPKCKLSVSKQPNTQVCRAEKPAKQATSSSPRARLGRNTAGGARKTEARLNTDCGVQCLGELEIDIARTKACRH